MKFDGEIDSSVFEFLVSKDEMYWVLTASKLEQIFPKSYRLIAQIGKELNFATDEPADATPLGKEAEQLFTIIEDATTPAEFMDMLSTIIIKISSAFVAWEDSKLEDYSRSVNYQSLVEERIKTVSANITRIVEEHSRKLFIHAV